MRVEIMIDKEHKISQTTLEALETRALPQPDPFVSQNGDPHSQRQCQRYRVDRLKT